MSAESAVPEVLHFRCPACAAGLSLPRAAAGARGPCPKCGREIVGPDPARGREASLPAPEAPPSPEPPPEPPREEPAAIPLDPPPSVPPVDEPAPRRAPASPGLPAPPNEVFRLLPVAVILLLMALAGFLLWKAMPLLRGDLEGEETRGAEAAASRGAFRDDEEAPPEAPEEAAGKAVADVAPAEPDPAKGEREVAAANAVLQAFLEAPNWAVRSAFVCSPERVKVMMREDLGSRDDGPIAVTATEMLRSEGDVTVFRVATEAFPAGFPVRVIATDVGPKVDWETFVDFHQDRLRKFVGGPAGTSGIFRVRVRREPAGPKDAESRHVRFRVSVPMPDREQVVWVPRGSPALERLEDLLDGAPGRAADGVPVVLDLAKKSGAGMSYVEVGGVVAAGWDPQP